MVVGQDPTMDQVDYGGISGPWGDSGDPSLRTMSSW